MERIIPEHETIEIEFKSDVKKLSDSDLIDAIVAFANTHGGDLYLGVEDDGTVTGLHEQHQDATQLSAFIANRTTHFGSNRVSSWGASGAGDPCAKEPQHCGFFCGEDSTPATESGRHAGKCSDVPP